MKRDTEVMGERVERESVDQVIPAGRLSSTWIAARKAMGAVLDAMPSHAAILDESGTILHVNAPWCEFDEEKGLVGSPYRVGSHYLSTCRSAIGPRTEVVDQVAQGIQRVMTGEVTHFSVEYACQSSTAKPWFLLRATRLELPGGLAGILLSHDNIDSMKVSEATLRGTEERFRRLLETTNVVPWEADAVTWQFTYVGPQAARLFGYPIERWYEKDFWTEHLFADDREGVIEFCRQHSQTDDQYEFEYRMPKVDGSIVWVHDLVTVARHEGRPDLLRGFLIDVTPRKKADQTLRESQERFSLAVQGSNTGIWDCDLKTNQTYFSTRWKSMLGYEESESMDGFEAWERRIHPEDRNRVLTVMNEYLGGRLPEYEIEHRLQYKDGSYRWILSRGVSVRDATGKPTRIAGSHVDITKFKETEEALHESEERFRLIADAAPIMMWMSGPDKRYIYFNKGWLEFTGRPIERELGDGWTDNVHPHDVRRCFETYAQAFDARESFSMEYRLRRHDGEYRWVWDIGVPRGESGRFAGYIGTCVDITDRKRAEIALRELSGRLINAQEEERARIARELHDDVNQRLALLGIELEQLGQQSATSTAQLGARSRALWNKVRELSADIHNLSHNLHPSKLDHLGLETAVRSFCNDHRGRGDFQIGCVFQDVPHALPKDIALCLYRVLQEAIQNALKHSGARNAKVEVRGSPSLITLSVSDSGIGFHPGAESMKTGLGLISMRERVRLVGGELSIQSRPVEGTRIEAHVPLDLSGSSQSEGGDR